MATDPGRDRCTCAAHRRESVSTTSWWGTLLPLLACAICPACLTTYAKLFSVAGVGVGLGETAHLILLGVAMVSSLVVSAWRSHRTRQAWPLALASLGVSLVLAGHCLGEVPWLEWGGIATLLAGGLTEHFRLRRPAAPAARPHQHAGGTQPAA
jgi:hypothetical protein